jgi:cysteine-rich repeat protein
MPAAARATVVFAVFALAACSVDTSAGGSDGGGTFNPFVDTGGDLDADDTGGGLDVGYDADDDALPGDVDDVGDDAVQDTYGGGSICGNGVVDRGEACDDGNNFSGDGCNATCSSDERCGNGITDQGESCDDGNNRPGDGCDALCQVEDGCGNGVLEVGEQCDDGNLTPGDGCSPGCILEIFLAVDTDGDGISDFDEGNGYIDTDGDGISDHLDTDSDNDGIPDSIEAGDGDLNTPPVDTDFDSIPDFRDLDSDDDGIPDAVEGADDLDGDGLGCYADTDCDGDYVPDSTERTVDTDGDGTPDYRDLDSDGDGILDAHELFPDSDGDGKANRIDLDSDGDGIPDRIEAGDADPTTYPVDTDNDGIPDYIDVDSDGDGLPDVLETGCASGSSDRLDPDSDNDGYSDLAEVLVGSNPCAHTSPTEFKTYTEFFFILPEYDPPQTEPLEFSSTISQADVHVAMDTTGSMFGEIDTLRTTFSSSILPGVNAQIPDVAFGVSTFDDFPCGDHGTGADRPFILRQRVTTRMSDAQAAMDAIPLHNGADYYESGYESMYQVATGAGVVGCGASIPPFNPATGLVPGVADGTIGGVGFRTDSFPMLVHVTDAPSHNGTTYGGYAATSGEAINALKANKIHFIGVASGSDPRGQLEAVAIATGGTVPTCAWDGARPSGCGASQCCTAINGTGRATSGGTCPLVFDINDSGAGLNSAIITAIRALANTKNFTVTARVRRDEAEYRASGIDTRCFIQSVTPDSYTGAGGTCSTTPEFADINPVDGIDDSFRNVTPGTQLFFDVTAENDGCVAETDIPQAFSAYIDVIGDGVTVLDSLLVTIIVPADTTNPSTLP